MTPLWHTVEKLAPTHDLSQFSCGLLSVDSWLQEKALANSHSVATHLCLKETGEIGAFYALKTVIVSTEGMSSKLRSGSMGGQSVGILLCQMGVSLEAQKNGHGKQLLRQAMTEAAVSHRSSPVQLFVVDAENESLVPFYAQAALTQIPNTLRLVAPMKSVAKALAL